MKAVDMKVAIIHDWLTGMRGGEKCLEVFCELFPGADLFTLVHISGCASPVIENRTIHTSFIQCLPKAETKYRTYLPLFPTAVERFDLSGYDLVLSSSHCVAKGVIAPPGAVHVCYCYTPVRYAWDMYPQYFPAGSMGKLKSLLIPFFMHYIRLWDVSSSRRVDRFIAISRHVARRIELYYRRESDVIYPPVDVEAFSPVPEQEDYYLCISALVPYKRIDLAVEAFNESGRPLVIIGAGPEADRLRSKAKDNIKFLGFQPAEVLSDHYAKCRAFLFPGEEDFGITPLEAQASGRPVIAFGAGGALETVKGLDACEGQPTGVFFPEQTPNALNEAVKTFEEKAQLFENGEAIRSHTLSFSRDRFADEISAYLEEATAGK